MLFLTEEGSILGLLTYMLYGDLLEIVSLNSLMWTRWGFTRGGGFDMARLFRNAMERSRQLKPEIPLIGQYGIALRHEIEFERILKSSADADPSEGKELA